MFPLSTLLPQVPGVVDDAALMRQLYYFNIRATTHIQRVAYPVGMNFSAFVNRFELCTNLWGGAKRGWVALGGSSQW